MSTQSFFVLNGEDTNEDAEIVLQGKDKQTLGVGVRKLSPTERKYLVCKLQNHWIVTEEDYKLLKQAKKK